MTREEYIKKLEKEIPLYSKDLFEINSHWPQIASLAETLLPQLPDIGFFSHKKRRMAYLHLERKLEMMVIKKEIPKSLKGHVLLLMEYSNRDFRKASRAGPLHRRE